MPNINATSTGRIGDENFAGVITKEVTDAINRIFFDESDVKPLKPAFLALGDGIAAASRYDTELNHEIARYPLTQLTQNDGVTTALVNLPITGGPISATELGVFTNSGVLLSRANVELEKNKNSILNIVWMLRVEEG